GRDELRRMHLGSELPAGDYVCLEVSDTGVGMDEATRARIFEPFFTTKFTGRGLGLAAVHGIMRTHRGAIGVCSEPGQGTMLRLAFPVVEQAARPPSPGAAVPWRGAGTLLVVDDEEGVRRFLTCVLQLQGFRVLQASDGEEALR